MYLGDCSAFVCFNQCPQRTVDKSRLGGDFVLPYIERDVAPLRNEKCDFACVVIVSVLMKAVTEKRVVFSFSVVAV